MIFDLDEEFARLAAWYAPGKSLLAGQRPI
jgi:hypothetical protein